MTQQGRQVGQIESRSPPMWISVMTAIGVAYYLFLISYAMYFWVNEEARYFTIQVRGETYAGARLSRGEWVLEDGSILTIGAGETYIRTKEQE